MHLNPALLALVVSSIPSVVARSIPLNSRYRAVSLGSHKSDPEEHPIAGNCLRTHDLNSLLESNLQTPFLVKSLGMEELHHLLGVYIVNSPDTRTCIYPQPTCPTDDIYGFMCTPPLASAGTSSVFEGNPRQSEPPAAYGRNLRHTAKQGQPSTSRTYSRNETACGKTGGSANALECVGTETRPDNNRGGCTVFSVVKDRYKSRLAGPDCAAISHADTVSCIPDERAVQSGLADTTRYVGDQMSDALSSAGHASGTTRSHEARCVLPHTLQQNTTSIIHVKPYAQRTPRALDTLSLGKRNAPSTDGSDRLITVGSGHIKEDWTRLPDYRRHPA